MPVTRGDSYILLPNHWRVNIGPPASEVFTLHHYPTAQTTTVATNTNSYEVF